MTPEPRNKLPQFNTIEDAVELISGARNIVVLTGAGVRGREGSEIVGREEWNVICMK